MPALNRRKIETVSDPEELLRLLIYTGKELPRRLRQRILELGPRAIPPLMALMEDEELSLEDAPGEGWGPIHAVELLGELKPPEAIEPMLDLLAETDWDTYLHDRILLVLPRFGSAALEPTLAAHAAATDPELRSDYCTIMAGLGVRDDRIYEALVEDLQRDLTMGAPHLGEYGDPRALPLLLAEVDRYEPGDPGPLLPNLALAELVEAIKALGGELTPEQQQKVDRIFAAEEAERRRWAALYERSGRGSPARPLIARKIGRNDPCPCGSGKKYKKCCLLKELGTEP